MDWAGVFAAEGSTLTIRKHITNQFLRGQIVPRTTVVLRSALEGNDQRANSTPLPTNGSCTSYYVSCGDNASSCCA